MNSKKGLSGGMKLPTRPPARTLVSEDQAAQFTGGAPTAQPAAAQAPEPVETPETLQTSGVPMPPQPRAGTRAGRFLKNEAWRKVTLYLPHELVHELKVRAAMDAKDMSDVVVEALRAHLAAKDEG
jgi:hypothetical protein